MRKLKDIALITMTAAFIVGCGGGGGGSSAAVGGTPPPNTNPPPPSGSLGSATISWLAPQENTNGTALTDLAGFEIRYGQNESSLDSYKTISGVGTTVSVIENLTTGTWYFTVAARNTQGVMSAPSGSVSKVIG